MISEQQAQVEIKEHHGSYTFNEEGDERYIVDLFGPQGHGAGYGFSLPVATEHAMRNAGLLPPAKVPEGIPPMLGRVSM